MQNTMQNTMQVLDDHKQEIPDGVYLELANSLMAAHNSQEVHNFYEVGYLYPILTRKKYNEDDDVEEENIVSYITKNQYSSQIVKICDAQANHITRALEEQGCCYLDIGLSFQRLCYHNMTEIVGKDVFIFCTIIRITKL